MAEKTKKSTSVERRDREAAPAESSDVDAFLAELKARPRPEGGHGRLIFALDATLSRQPTWDRAMAIQGDMFLEAGRIGGLEVQLVFFRGHREMKASKWVSDAPALLRLMTSVRCRGGLTQIERLLRHAIKESRKSPVQAVVYVGDACEEDPDRLCHLAGELGILKTPLFVFHEGGDPLAAIAFREIARLSGGAYAAFNASSPEELKALLRAVAAYAAGGKAAMARIASDTGAGARRLLEQMK